MTLDAILKSGGVSILVLLTLIQIAPIKINPWSAIFGGFGKLIFKPIIERLDKLEKKVDAIERQGDVRHITDCRTRILRFADEVQSTSQPLHGKEHFRQIMEDIDEYEKYCRDHEDFANNVAVASIRYIKASYDKRFENGEFR